MNKVDYMTLRFNFALGDLVIHKDFKSHIKTVDKIIVNVYNWIIGGGHCE